ncbi:MAG: acyltransferase [Deltaproteobacteria bacterium]|nr:acyltransferase [Deltaproteobacteria bacterium]
MGAYCIIGKAKIGQHCTIGSHVNILSGKRQHIFTEIDKPIQEQGGVFESVSIGDNCWIGNGAIVMANTGKQCIIGAGSVVTKDTGDYEVLAGNPAKVVRKLASETENG